MSFQSKKLLKPSELVPKDESPIAVVIGAMAHGQVIYNNIFLLKKQNDQ